MSSRIKQTFSRGWDAIKSNPKKSAAIAIAAVAVAALLLTTFAIPQTTGAMKHGWSLVGHQFAHSQPLQLATTAVGGITAGVLLGRGCRKSAPAELHNERTARLTIV